MNSDKVKSEKETKPDALTYIKKIESELPLNIIIYISIFLLTLAVVVENKINILGYSFNLDNLYPLGVFILISLASLLCGLLVGFIFGLPRVMSENNLSYSNMYGDNSNLDQISDWLVKILVGVGLVQLGELPSILGKLEISLKNALKFDGSGIVGVSLLITFSVAGFLCGYLWTRRCAASMFMEGLSKLHNIEESMDDDKEDIKINTEKMASENRKIIESIQNNQQNFCKWMKKVTKQVNSFEKCQKNYSTLNSRNSSLQAMVDCMYPVDGDLCLEKIQNLESKINTQIKERASKQYHSNQDPSNKGSSNKGSSNSCQKTKDKSSLQTKMKDNKNEIKEYTKELSDKNRQIMESIESNQKEFATWMGIFEDRLKAITDNQIYINFSMTENDETGSKNLDSALSENNLSR